MDDDAKGEAEGSVSKRALPPPFMEGVDFVVMDAKAEVIQRYWRTYLQRKRETERILAILPEIRKLCDLIQLFRTNTNLEFVQAALQHQAVLDCADVFISAISKDKHTLQLPRQFRSARAFLSSFFVKYFPDALMGEGERGFHAKRVTNAASMLLGSLVPLQLGVQLAAQGTTGYLGALSQRVSYTAFAYNYYTLAFCEWKQSDQAQFTNELLQNYATIYMAAQQDSSNQQHKQILMQVCMMLSKVLSPDELKAALDQIHEQVANIIEAPPRPQPSQPNIRDSTAAEELRKLSVGETNASAAGAGKVEGALHGPAPPPTQEKEAELPAFVDQFVTNEAMAHELILDPDNFIRSVCGRGPNDDVESEDDEDADLDVFNEGGLGAASAGTGGSRAAQVAATMRRAFWDRVLHAMAPQLRTLATVQVGDAVLSRQLAEDAALYPAVVVGKEAGPGGALHLRCAAGPRAGQVLQGVARADVQLGPAPPPDYSPLLSVLAEVRDKLVGLAPNNRALAEEVGAAMDEALLRQMLEREAFDGGSVRRLVAFAGQQVLALQAPARAARTRRWLGRFEAWGAGRPAADLVPRLPAVFEWLFARIDEVRADIMAFQLGQAVPHLRRHGVAYEKGKLAAALASGALPTAKAAAWLAAVARGWAAAAAAAGGAAAGARRAAAARALAAAPAALRAEFFAEAFLELLRGERARPVPETLRFDGRRLLAAQAGWRRCALAAALGAAVAGWARAAGRPPLGPAGRGRFEREVAALVSQQGVVLEDLVEQGVAAARRGPPPGSRGPSRSASPAPQGAGPGAGGALRRSESVDGWGAGVGPPLAPEQEQQLRALLAAVAAPAHPAHRIAHRRVGRALRAALLPPGGELAAASGSEEEAGAVGERGGGGEGAAAALSGELGRELALVAAPLGRLVRHHQAVHLDLYARLLAERASGEGEGEGEGKAEGEGEGEIEGVKLGRA